MNSVTEWFRSNPSDRKWREKTGRICTELAAKADSVTRVVCGIGILLKGEEKHD